MTTKLYTGDCLEVLAKLPAGSVDAVVTDPPYGLGFMGKRWDASLPSLRVWDECFRLMQPGAYLMAFGGTRTYHRLISAIEDAGFEIRDCLNWLYGSGFPKGKGCLKPAWEPITLARKPGGKIKPLGIEDCRVPAPGGLTKGGYHWPNRGVAYAQDEWTKANMCERSHEHPDGRWPPNLLLQHHPECNGECHPECVVRVLGEQSGESQQIDRRKEKIRRSHGDYWKHGGGGFTTTGNTPAYPDSGTAARFYPQFRYAAKASRRERNAGLEGMNHSPRRHGEVRSSISAANSHPTVKPLAVMEWLVKLACPEGGTVLDPFAGSGTTGVACKQLGRSFIGIDIDAGYARIARKRIAAAVSASPQLATSH